MTDPQTLRDAFRRKRYGPGEYDPDFDLFDAAADEIERLRKAIEYACHSLDLGRITSTVASELRAAVGQFTMKGDGV